ncbi:MAG: cytochrome P450 [Labilithrix sp.]|nr:cytochrome P450 [Labilithrix sp.]
MRLPPGPRHSAAWSTWQWLRAPYPYLDRLSKELGETFTMRLLAFDLVFFSNPEDVKEVFLDNGETLEAGRFNSTLAPLLGDRSVLMVDGRAHRRKRKLLLPPFHGERMQVYGPTMLDVTDEAIDSFRHGEPFSFHEPMQDITLRVIVRTVFGFEGARLEEMVQSTKRLLELGTWPPLLLPFLQVDLGRLNHYGRFRRAVAENDALLYAEIRRRRRDGTRGPDILSLLLDARDEDGEPMSDEELRDELVTLLVAGHETSATGLTWAMRWLLDAPEPLADLRAELDALGPDPTPEAIAKCELLDATVREALRLVPVIPIVGRVLAKDQRVGGWDLKEGTVVVCSIYLAHRRPEAFPDPERFDPRRFFGKKLSAHEFFPFGGGVRRCIGMAFALYEMKMVLARIVTRCELALEGRRPVGMVRRSITITPSDGLRVVLQKRRPFLRARLAS